MEKISVVIPAFNAEATIEQAVNSVRDQSYRDVEIIVVDDGSEDNTPELLYSMQERIPQLKVIRQENRGVSAARNAGIRAASGRWLMTLDDDDYIDPECLAWMELRTRDGACDLVMCGMKLVYADRVESFRAEHEFIDDKESFLKKEMLWLYDNHLLTTHSNKLYDMDIIRREHLLYDPGLQINEDIDFVLRYLKHCENIGIIKGAYLNYVQHDVGQSLITTFQRYGVSSSVRLMGDVKSLFEDMEPGRELKNGMYNRLLVHALSFVGIMYYRSTLSDAEKLEAIRELNSRQEFRELLKKTSPQSLKTAAAQFLLLTRQDRLYHWMCRQMYRGYN